MQGKQFPSRDPYNFHNVPRYSLARFFSFKKTFVFGEKQSSMRMGPIYMAFSSLFKHVGTRNMSFFTQVTSFSPTFGTLP